MPDVKFVTGIFILGRCFVACLWALIGQMGF